MTFHRRPISLPVHAVLAGAFLVPMLVLGMPGDSSAQEPPSRRSAIAIRPASGDGASRTDVRAGKIRESLSVRAARSSMEGDLSQAALLFFLAQESGSDGGTDGPGAPDVQEAGAQALPSANSQGEREEQERLRAEVETGHALLAMGLFDAALHQYDYVLRAGQNHPAYLEAAEGVITVASLAREDILTTAILDREYGDGLAGLPVHMVHRLNLSMGLMALRAGRLEEAEDFLQTVSHEGGELGARASYLRGVLRAREGRHQEALQFFQSASRPPAAGGSHLNASGQKAGEEPSGLLDFQDLATTFASRHANRARNSAFLLARNRAERDDAESKEGGFIPGLAELATARTLFAMERYAEAAKAYESIPRFSPRWESSLLENGWARLLAGDDGGALGTLMALHTPQMEGSFQPESRILFATVNFSRCLFQEMRASLDEFQAVYGPQKAALETILQAKKGIDADPSSEPKEPEDWIRLASVQGRLPEPLRRELIRNHRYRSISGELSRLSAERKAILEAPGWDQGGFRDMLISQNGRSEKILKQVLADFIRKRLSLALEQIRTFDAKREILLLEADRVESEELEAGFQKNDHLNGQELGRPPVGEGDIYWPFDGEIWADEIGRHRFTLKNGCMPPRSPATSVPQAQKSSK